mmetsp:Transcript_84346/g.149107  ORF Transcript_84346/g.149107 Transcript_84346/m.149107 type:complete len:486 (+) Transcript_84346:96-1553(+)
MNQIIAVFASLLGLAVGRSQLPKLHTEKHPSALLQEGQWWAKVGDHFVHAPDETSGLSKDVGDYYYTYGSHAALTQELKDKRVGGDGRLHILHLPDGVDSLSQELPKGGRRNSVAAFVQLKHEAQLSNAKIFPAYAVPAGYGSGLSPGGEELEKKVVAAITSDAAMSQLEELTSLGDDSFTTRSWSNPKATENCVNYIEKQFKDMGYSTCVQSFTSSGTGLKSVIAYLPGTEGSTKGTVTLGGHYDSRPFEGLAPGAVDNGSGSAAVLSIAKAIANAKVKPQRSIFFVAFAAEEPGLLGSKEFAQRLKDAKANVAFLEGDSDSDAETSLLKRMCGKEFEGVANLLQDQSGQKHKKRNHREDSKHEALIMDEIAWRSTNIDLSMGPVVNLESYDWSTHVLNHLAAASKEHNQDALKVTHSGNPFGSDHMSFLDLGFQAVLTIHGDDEGYPNYHSSDDNMEKVDPELYTLIMKMNAGALLRLSGVSA